MKKLYFILAAALACFATACTETEQTIVSEEPETSQITYIQANANENDTKASIDGSTGAFTWNTGDQIAVFSTNGNKYCVSNPLADTYEGKNAVEFAFSGSNAINQNERANFAIYPASLVDNVYSKGNYGSHLSLRLPSSYEFEQVAGTKSPVPMIATNTPNGTLSFKQLCALLRVTVKGIPAKTARLEFAFSNDVKVIGDFMINFVEAGVSSLSSDGYQITDAGSTPNTINVKMPANFEYIDAVDINLPIPVIPSNATIGYDKITVTAYDSNDNAILKIRNNIKSDGTNWKPARRAARKMTAPLPVFSVSYSNRIVFAPGNLQWQYLTGANGTVFTHKVALTNSESYNSTAYATKSYNGGMFFFASNQIETTGVYNWPDKRINLGSDKNAQAETNLSAFIGPSAIELTKRIDLFVFASSGYRGPHVTSDYLYYHYKPFAVCNSGHYASNGDYGNQNDPIINTNYDWGHFNEISKNQVGDQCYKPGVWGLLTVAEWDYLLNTRSGAKQKRGFAKINNRCGLILLPDNWTWTPSHPEKPFVPFETAIGYDDPENLAISWTTYSPDEWLTMEAAGAVFLPAGGSINPTNNKVENWDDGYSAGYYWTASAANGEYQTDYRYAYCINFGTESNGVHWRKDQSERHWGRSVRLVRRLN